MKKVIVYFTDSRLEESLEKAVREQILKAAKGIPIISVSQKPLDFGKNICVGTKPRCYLSLYEQLLIGVKAAEKDALIYLCEHDVFYNPTHFEYIPPRKNKIYYNLNRYYWTLNAEFFLVAIGKRALSQSVAYKEVLLAHAKEQVASRRANIASPCFGPFKNFTTRYPNIDIRHGGNFSIFGKFEKSHRSRRYEKIDYWGSPGYFQRKVNYRNIGTDTETYLHSMFNPDGEFKNPITIEPILRKDFPGLFSFFGFKRGAEVGVKMGRYSKELCDGIPDLYLRSIDPYLPTPKLTWDKAETFFVVARHTLKDFNAKVIKKTSLQAADEDVPKWDLDFVYIDGSHRFNDVVQDIIAWSDRVRPGGIVSGHDYNNEGVKTAVDAYVKIHDHELFVTKSVGSYPDASPSWFFARKDHLRGMNEKEKV